MKKYCSFAILIIISLWSVIHADTHTSIKNLDDLDKYGLLAANPLNEKQSELIKKFQMKEGIAILNGPLSKYSDIRVEKMRNSEVLLITIPAARLFMPNDTILRADAGKYLDPFKRYLKNPDMYWVILDMHTDNTGSDDYTDNLSLQRVSAVFDWFAEKDCDTQYLFPTASGSSEPLPGNHNQTLKERRENRRLEILLVPGIKMAEEAKKGRISF